MTKFIPGDLVKTKWGNAIVGTANTIPDHMPGWGAEENAIGSYCVCHLPGYTEYIRVGGVSFGPKGA